MSCITCHVTCVTCHLSLTPTATATNPSPANSPTMQCRIVYSNKNIYIWSIETFKKNSFLLATSSDVLFDQNIQSTGKWGFQERTHDKQTNKHLDTSLTPGDKSLVMKYFFRWEFVPISTGTIISLVVWQFPKYGNILYLMFFSLALNLKIFVYMCAEQNIAVHRYYPLSNDEESQQTQLL